ncbi:MAG: hypothetical protein ACSLFM_08680 [Tepidiformaceae bacterium]
MGKFATSAFLGVLVFYLLMGGIAASTLRSTRIWSSAQPLPSEERDAMAWVAAETPEGARFAVITDATRWSSDRSAEWFPYLTGRVSVSTVQGLEWVRGDAFEDARDAFEELQGVVRKGSPASMPGPASTRVRSNTSTSRRAKTRRATSASGSRHAATCS